MYIIYIYIHIYIYYAEYIYIYYAEYIYIYMDMKVIIHSMVPNNQPAVGVSLMEIACRKAASERR